MNQNILHFDLRHYRDLEINAEMLQEGYALISLTGRNQLKAYYHDMYLEIEEYLKQISGNNCPHCGAEITGAGKFCANCGATLK